MRAENEREQGDQELANDWTRLAVSEISMVLQGEALRNRHRPTRFGARSANSYKLVCSISRRL